MGDNIGEGEDRRKPAVGEPYKFRIKFTLGKNRIPNLVLTRQTRS
jgi:hypothetical protein